MENVLMVIGAGVSLFCAIKLVSFAVHKSYLNAISANLNAWGMHALSEQLQWAVADDADGKAMWAMVIELKSKGVPAQHAAEMLADSCCQENFGCSLDEYLNLAAD